MFIIKWGEHKHVVCIARVQELMVENDVTVDAMTFQSLTEVYAAARDVNRLHQTHTMMRSSGLCYTREAYNALLECYGTSGRLDLVRLTLKEMLDIGIVLQSGVFKVLAGVCSQEVDVDVLDHLVEVARQSEVVLDVEDATNLIAAYGRAKNMSKAQSIFTNLGHCGVAPNARVFDALLKAYTHSGHYHQFQAVLRDMWTVGIPPTHETFG